MDVKNEELVAVQAEQTLAVWLDEVALDTDTVRDAIAALMKSDPDRLAYCLERALERGISQPGIESAEIHTALAFARQDTGDLDSAAAHAEAALVAHPESPHVLGLLAAVRAMQNRPREAFDAAQRAVSLGEGDNADLLVILGLSLVQMRRGGEAIPVLRRARSLDTSLKGVREALLRAYLVKWGFLVRALTFVAAFWAIVDSSAVGWVMAAIAAVILGMLSVLAARVRRVRAAASFVLIAVAVVAGHVFLAPTAIG